MAMMMTWLLPSNECEIVISFEWLAHLGRTPRLNSVTSTMAAVYWRLS